MKADGILRVTDSIRDRLTAALASSGLPGTVFVGPLDDPAANAAALVLFLYRVIPTPSLRNREHRVATGAVPPIEIYRNALPLDLYFLITVGTLAGGSGDTPLLGLGYAMQALQENPELTGASVNHETVRLSIEPLTTEEASRIWALYPAANYRTTIAYLATPVWIDPDVPDVLATPVVQEQLYAGGKPTATGAAA
jgi:hypothetical protein